MFREMRRSRQRLDYARAEEILRRAPHGVLAVLGTLSALSFGVLSDVKLFGKTIFDLFDYATSNIGMPIGVLGLALVCGWIAWPMTRSQLTGNQHWPAWLLQGLRVVMTIIAPVVIVAVMLKGLGLF